MGISGVSGDEGYGGFSESGTTTKSSTLSAIYHIAGASNNDMRASTTWSNDFIQCTIDGKGDVNEYWQAVFDSIAAPNGTPGAPAVAAGKCVDLGTQPVTYDTQTESTWSAGVSIASKIGINLSSQSGYTSESYLTIAAKVESPVCGTTNFPNAQSGSAVGYIQLH